MSAGTVLIGAERTPVLADSSAGRFRSTGSWVATQRRKSPSDSEPSRWPLVSTRKMMRARLALIFSSARSTGSSAYTR